MRVLAIDTAAQWATVAVAWDGLVGYRQLPGYARHSEHLLPTVAELFVELAISDWQDGLQAVAFAAGPGAFTGIRLACSAAQGLGMALGCPVLALDSLELVGRSAFATAPPPMVVTLIDARMGQWYARPFAVTKELWQPIAPPILVDAGNWQEIISLAEKEGAGSTPLAIAAWQIPLNKEELPPEIGQVVTIDAIAPAPLLTAASIAFAAGRAVPAELAEPVYVRQRVALTATEQAKRRQARTSANA